MDLLKKHFDIALETPDGIKKLRELILTLAMQGKLVKQDPKDQPASELLKEIEEEKKRLVKEGKRKERDLTRSREVAKEDVPYQLPNGWEWVRIQDCYFSMGNKNNQLQTKDYNETGEIPIIDQGKAFITGYSNDVDKILKINNPVIIFGDHTKHIKYVDFDFIIGADGVKVLSPYSGIFPRFFFYKIKSYNLTDRGYARHFNVLNAKLFSLPPLAEQRRIVAKIDQLMELCDKLESERNERNQKRLTVHTASMNRLFTAQDKKSFDKSWQFITKHFNQLYSVTENVAELKKAILQLAVMGKLVPQDQNDQPASELLKEIEQEKNRLIEKKMLKIGQLTKDTKCINQNIQIPSNWIWVKGEEIFFITKLAGFEYTDHVKLGDIGEIPVIRAQNVRPFNLDTDNLKYIDLETSKKLERCALTKKALLVTFIGAGIGDVALFDKKERWHLAPNVAKMEPFDNCENRLDLKYFNYYLLSDQGKNEIFKHLKSTAQPSISMGTIRDIDYPLPPLAEQRRIVAKIDQLMTLCDTLNKQITSSTDKKTAILNAVMAQV